MISKSRFVLVLCEGDPNSRKNQSILPLLIREMCAELIENNVVLSSRELILQILAHGYVDFDAGFVNMSKVIEKMAWGDWLKVGMDTIHPEQGVYVVKVIDHQIEESEDKGL